MLAKGPTRGSPSPIELGCVPRSMYSGRTTPTARLYQVIQVAHLGALLARSQAEPWERGGDTARQSQL